MNEENKEVDEMFSELFGDEVLKPELWCQYINVVGMNDDYYAVKLSNIGPTFNDCLKVIKKICSKYVVEKKYWLLKKECYDILGRKLVEVVGYKKPFNAEKELKYIENLIVEKTFMIEDIWERRTFIYDLIQVLIKQHKDFTEVVEMIKKSVEKKAKISKEQIEKPFEVEKGRKEVIK